MRASLWFDEATLDRGAADSASSRTRPAESSRRPAPRTPAVQLERGCIFSRPLEEGECVSVMVTTGHAWITMECDVRDHVLAANDERVFAGPGLLVIEGLEQGARLQLKSAS
ncbi:DUF2917 domain-containing protein [Roseimicrobium gellanilyticum]|uniref:DUF2917 domain-containing protein n=1 Tax=Roseimicrobium gellanilyticum TaxID=748857 RepID=UPI003CCC5F58